MSSSLKTATLRGDLQAAMTEALGQAHDVDFVQEDAVRVWLHPVYKALPKNSVGHVDRHAMEHAVHRYFTQKYGMSLKPFEPHRSLNGSELGASEVLEDRAGAFVEEILRGRFAHDGFGFNDAVQMVMTLEQLLFDDSARRVSRAYELCHDMNELPDGNREILHDDAIHVLSTFIDLMSDPNLDGCSLDFINPSVLDAADSELSRMRWKRMHRGPSKTALTKHTTIDEVIHAAHSMVLNGHKLMNSCDALRQHLTSMDKTEIGRIALSKFYWSDHPQYEFAESKDWLRRMGVLDETSNWIGPQVIIPNYIAAASNCIMDTPLFRVCCTNHACNALVSDLETLIGSSAASAENIWELAADLEGMREEGGDSHAEEPRKAMHMASLMKKLHVVEEHHNGSIPLHGRLFSQWLHFLTPQQCPYPHKRGTIEEVGLGDCGNGCLVTDEDKDTEKKIHKGKISYFNPDTAADDEEFWMSDEFWMSQWTLEEELIHRPKVDAAGSDIPRQMMALAGAFIVVVPLFWLSSCLISAASKNGLLATGKGGKGGSGALGVAILGKSHDV